MRAILCLVVSARALLRPLAVTRPWTRRLQDAASTRLQAAPTQSHVAAADADPTPRFPARRAVAAAALGVALLPHKAIAKDEFALTACRGIVQGDACYDVGFFVSRGLGVAVVGGLLTLLYLPTFVDQTIEKAYAKQLAEIKRLMGNMERTGPESATRPPSGEYAGTSEEYDLQVTKETAVGVSPGVLGDTTIGDWKVEIDEDSRRNQEVALDLRFDAEGRVTGQATRGADACSTVEGRWIAGGKGDHRCMWIETGDDGLELLVTADQKEGEFFFTHISSRGVAGKTLVNLSKET